MRRGFRYLFFSFVCCVLSVVGLQPFLRELYVTDIHKPGVCRSGRARTNTWGLVCSTPSQVGCGHCAALFSVCILSAAGFRFTLPFFPANAHGLRHVSGGLASFTSLLQCVVIESGHQHTRKRAFGTSHRGKTACADRSGRLRSPAPKVSGRTGTANICRRGANNRARIQRDLM